MAQVNNEVINGFTIEMTLINPIQNIVTKLNNGEFRDCDIKWLDAKLEAFMQFAAKTLSIDLPAQVPAETKGRVMNDHTKNKYLGYFNGLLAHFKSF